MKKAIIILTTLIGFISCTKNQKIDTKVENKKNMPNNIENILRKQIMEGYSENQSGLDGDSTYPYSDKDMEVCVELSENILKAQGYKFPSQTEFENKIKEVFKFTNKRNPINFLIEYPCLRDSIVYQLDINYVASNNLPLFIFFDKKFISEPLFIPELIDYKKEYPQIVEEENSIPDKRIDKYGFEVFITKWRDLQYLNENRDQNIQTLINRNKYLFNDNKASFAWLKFNDSLFLESLVKTFGYMNDKELLKWVIDKTLSDKNNKGEDFNSLLFMKDCSNKFVFHKETFEVLKENISNKTLEALENYVYYREENKELQALPFEQKAQVLAYVLYTGEYFAQQEKYSSRFMFKFMGTFYEFDKERDKYDEEFKKNNYYNLPDFKKLWEQAKEEGDGIGLPM